MQLVEQHIIDQRDPRWSALDAACFLSKNLYNATLFILRQHFIATGTTISYKRLASQMKTNPDYCALPRKISQWVLKQVVHDWQAFFAALTAWKRQPERFLGRPNLPKYKHKTVGRNLLVYTVQAIDKRAFKAKGIIQPSQLDVTIKTQQQVFNQVRIVPRKTHYVVEVVYTIQAQSATGEAARVASIDIGLNNLATVTFNQPELPPLLVNGRPLKAINQYYNKQRAWLQSQFKGEQKTSHQMECLTDKRNRRMNTYLHLTSRRLIDLLRLYGIGTLVIGKNDSGSRTSTWALEQIRTLSRFSHARFIDMLTYKAQMVGIQVIVTEESYTSKCSFLDLEPIGKRKVYAGKRVKRWLFIASDGREIHADVNGSYNIMRKVIPNAFAAWGIGASVVMPVRVTPH